MSLLLNILRRLLPAVILGVASAAFGSLDGSLEAKQVREYLRTMPAIRIAMIDAPGNGHQAVAVLLAKRLREIGYEGTIELLYASSAKAKLEFLLPPFRADGPDQQYIPDGNLILKPLGERPADNLPLGLLAGDYNSQMSHRLHIKPEDINVQFLLTIQPPRWGDYPSLRWSLFMSSLRSVSHTWPVRQNFALPQDLSSFLTEEMSHSKRLAGKIKGLTDLVTLADQERIEFLSAYGLGFEGEAKLAHLLAALEVVKNRAPHEFHGPIVIGLISNLNAGEWERFSSRLENVSDAEPNVKIVEIDSPNLRKQLYSGNDRSTYIVKIGAVSQEVWNLLNYKSSLPPLVAGTTGVNYLLLLGRPFLITKTSFGFHSWSSPDHDSQKLRDILFKTTKALEDGDLSPLADFYIESRKSGSDVRHLFYDQARRLDAMPDRTCSALLEAQDQIELLQANWTLRYLNQFANRLQSLLRRYSTSRAFK